MVYSEQWQWKQSESTGKEMKLNNENRVGAEEKQKLLPQYLRRRERYDAHIGWKSEKRYKIK